MVANALKATPDEKYLWLLGIGTQSPTWSQGWYIDAISQKMFLFLNLIRILQASQPAFCALCSATGTGQPLRIHKFAYRRIASHRIPEKNKPQCYYLNIETIMNSGMINHYGTIGCTPTSVPLWEIPLYALYSDYLWVIIPKNPWRTQYIPWLHC